MSYAPREPPARPRFVAACSHTGTVVALDADGFVWLLAPEQNRRSEWVRLLLPSGSRVVAISLESSAAEDARRVVQPLVSGAPIIVATCADGSIQARRAVAIESPVDSRGMGVTPWRELGRESVSSVNEAHVPIDDEQPARRAKGK